MSGNAIYSIGDRPLSVDNNKEEVLKAFGDLLDKNNDKLMTKSNWTQLSNEALQPCEIEKRHNDVKAGYYLLGAMRAKNDPQWDLSKYNEDQLRKEIDELEKQG